MSPTVNTLNCNYKLYTNPDNVTGIECIRDLYLKNISVAKNVKGIVVIVVLYVVVIGSILDNNNITYNNTQDN